MTNLQKEKIIKLKSDGASYKKIAQKMKMSENAVKSFFYRLNKSNCPVCGAVITGKKRFCSDKCRMDWWRKHPHQTAKMTETACAICGKKIISYPSKHRKYCSKKCYGQSCRKEIRHEN